MYDRHRDMRLDVDNMSYEVESQKRFFGVIVIEKTVLVMQFLPVITGVAGFGRAHWKCQYWIERRNYRKQLKTAEILCCCWSEGGG